VTLRLRAMVRQSLDGGEGASGMSQAERPRAYATLDGLRGVAALIVVTRHIGAILPQDPFPESFLAVDLFFLLSGFVIAHAYEARLLAGRKIGMSVLAFLRTRLIRLYPLYALGLALGLAAAVLQGLAKGAPGEGSFLLKAVVIGALMLPAVPPLPMGSSALDGPTWTLLPELVANMVYAAGLRRLGPRVLTAVVALGAAGLIACEARRGTLDGGWSVDAFPLVAARLGFSFFLGVAMFRLRPVRRVGPAAASACLAMVAGALMLHPPESVRRLYELLVVLVVFPATVWVAVHREPGALGAPLFSFLGLVSYAVYVLHAPLGALVAMALAAAGYPAQGPLAAVLFMLGVVLASALIDRLYDAPVRRWLSRRGRMCAPSRPLSAEPASS
jgi:peptidoglycan/LPS O-acetylase OafA/YrhL